MDRKFEVPVYYDGPWLHGEAVVHVAAADPEDAVREAIALIGPPKVGKVSEES
jgi:hypothetical protein